MKFGIVLLNVLLGITVLTITPVVSFSPICVNRNHNRGSSDCQVRCPSSGRYQSIKEEVEEDNKTIAESVYTKGKVKLVFRAEKDLASEPVSLPSSSSSSSLDDFFKSNKVTVLRGEDNQVEEASNKIQDYLYPLWVRKCNEKGLTEPNKEDNDTIYKIINSGANFPGLKIKSKIYMGCKLLPSSESKSGYPEIENIMLSTQDYAEGPRFLVWLYKKLTGTSSSNTNNYEGDDEIQFLESNGATEPTTEAMSKFYVTPSEDENTILFHSSTNLRIAVEFSEFLLKVMPMDKEKSEMAGSESIAKVIEKDNGATLDIWTNAYKSWLTTTSNQ